VVRVAVGAGVDVDGADDAVELAGARPAGVVLGDAGGVGGVADDAVAGLVAVGEAGVDLGEECPMTGAGNQSLIVGLLGERVVGSRSCSGVTGSPASSSASATSSRAGHGSGIDHS
jgi:hypothetical protein